MGEEPSGSQTSRSGLHIGKHPRCFGHRTSVEERLTGPAQIGIETYRAEGEYSRQVDAWTPFDTQPASKSEEGFPCSLWGRRLRRDLACRYICAGRARAIANRNEMARWSRAELVRQVEGLS